MSVMSGVAAAGAIAAAGAFFAAGAAALGVGAGAAGASADARPAAGSIPNNMSTCQASGWDMNRELQAFGRPPQSVAAATGKAQLPTLRSDHLYAVRLHAQSDVHFVEPLSRPGKSVTPMGGMVQFTVPSSGSYRVTVDAPLWIDVVTAKGLIAPAAYTGWHECSLFRKSVVFTLDAGQAATLQLSDAATDLVKVTIESPTP
jgi:hypothetical protein